MFRKTGEPIKTENPQAFQIPNKKAGDNSGNSDLRLVEVPKQNNSNK